MEQNANSVASQYSATDAESSPTSPSTPRRASSASSPMSTGSTESSPSTPTYSSTSSASSPMSTSSTESTPPPRPTPEPPQHSNNPDDKYEFRLDDQNLYEPKDEDDTGAIPKLATIMVLILCCITMHGWTASTVESVLSLISLCVPGKCLLPKTFATFTKVCIL
jgi:cobalamin biosynthesis Mg chelatase CobN